MPNSLYTSNYLHNQYYHTLNKLTLNAIEARNVANQAINEAKIASVNAVNAMHEAQKEIYDTEMEGAKTEIERKLYLIAECAQKRANSAKLIALQHEKIANDYEKFIMANIPENEFDMNSRKESILLAPIYSIYEDGTGQNVRIGGKKKQVQNNRTNKRLKKRKPKTYKKRKSKTYRI
jgi:hypothetical protein